MQLPNRQRCLIAEGERLLELYHRFEKVSNSVAKSL
jgi:hypothetical protein